jgi:hypothetical protein
MSGPKPAQRDLCARGVYSASVLMDGEPFHAQGTEHTHGRHDVQEFRNEARHVTTSPRNDEQPGWLNRVPLL